MNGIEDIPLWLALIIAALLVLGSTLAFLGAVGLTSLRSFYERLHPPTLGTTLGVASISLASVLLFSFLAGRVVLQEVVIVIAVIFTTPATLTMLARAALRRDRAKRDPNLPEAQHMALAHRPPPRKQSDGKG